MKVSPMRSIALLSQKGGSGKTTLGIHLAVASEAAGERACLIDTDPQGSAIAWRQARQLNRPHVVSATPSTIGRMLEDARQDGVSLVVIDTAPHLQPGTSQVIAQADLLLIPCRPSALDLATIPASLRLAEAAGKSVAIVLNACPARAPEVGEALEALGTYAVPVAPVSIGDRRTFARAIASGRAATEFEARGRAAQEVTALWQWLVKQSLPR
jgi:chromosome partitioning protein